MDVLYFLKERTKFIRRFYDTAGEPFREAMRKIDACEHPFDNPPYSEDGEPPFLEEWMEAADSLEVLGRTCISMLSASLQLYFKTWEGELIVWRKGGRERAFKNGFLQGYKTCFGSALALEWNNCPADLELIEQIILARNRDQHPDHIATMQVSHTYRDQRRFSQLFFVREAERRLHSDPEIESLAWMTATVHVSRDMLLSAICEIEKLTEWLEERMLDAKYPRRRG